MAPSWGTPDISWGQMAGLCPSDANSEVLYSQPVREDVVMYVIVRFGAPLRSPDFLCEAEPGIPSTLWVSASFSVEWAGQPCPASATGSLSGQMSLVSGGFALNLRGCVVAFRCPREAFLDASVGLGAVCPQAPYIFC